MYFGLFNYQLIYSSRQYPGINPLFLNILLRYLDIAITYYLSGGIIFMFNKLRVREEGQGLVEYALILVLVAIVVIAILLRWRVFPER